MSSKFVYESEFDVEILRSWLGERVNTSKFHNIFPRVIDDVEGVVVGLVPKTQSEVVYVLTDDGEHVEVHTNWLEVSS